MTDRRRDPLEGMEGPRLDVPCPRCAAPAPAGVPRHATILSISERERTAADLGAADPWHVESRCPAGHDVHVYYTRRFTDPADP
ncbi:MAG: hypothetical protein ABEJ22_05315 [Haloferacaceae archaeon]